MLEIFEKQFFQKAKDFSLIEIVYYILRNQIVICNQEKFKQSPMYN